MTALALSLAPLLAGGALVWYLIWALDAPERTRKATREEHRRKLPGKIRRMDAKYSQVSAMLEDLRRQQREAEKYHREREAYYKARGYKRVAPRVMEMDGHVIVIGNRSEPLRKDFVSSGRERTKV